MALKGFLGAKRTPSPTTTSDPNLAPEKPVPSYEAGDVENAGFGPRKGSRIDKPRTGSLVPAGVEADEGSVTVGKQMEMEADNAIKYRTCSWPKVLRSPPLSVP